jgi:lipoprotein-anchoring transpeptidase ErfK/SrfK
MKAAVVRFFGHGGGAAWYLIAAMMVVTAFSTALFVSTMVAVRFQRDVTRMVFEDDVDLLERIAAREDMTSSALQREMEAAPDKPRTDPYIVVSIDDHRLWYRRAGEVLFTAEVATGSGKTLVKESGGTYKFDTPRGRLVIRSKEEEPVWVPPDWHFEEQAQKRGLGVAHMRPGESLRMADGSVLEVSGDDVVRRDAGGRVTVLQATDGREIVADGKIVVPPVGTNQRKYKGVLGAHRLNMGDGYALHGTNQPASIGRSVSHGCVRLRNEDIDRLYDMVAVGTPVFIY